MRHPERCEMHGCHDPAHWVVLSDGIVVCEGHAVHALEMGRAVIGAVSGMRVALDEDHAIVLA
jgi:hypothetical protein